MQKKMRRASMIAMGSAGLMMSLLPVMPAFAATSGDPMIPSITLTESGNTFTAKGVDHGSTKLEYQFVVTPPNGHAYIAQRFTTGNTFHFTAPAAGYKVQANAMTAYQVQNKEWNIHTGSNVIAATYVTVSAPTVTASNLTFTAKATAPKGVTLYYQFLVKKPDGTWFIAQKFSTSNRYTLPSNLAGATVKANVLTEAEWQAKDWNAAIGSNYTSTAATVSTPTLMAVGNTFTAKATSSDGTPVYYQFLIKNPSGSWSIAQRFSPTNTYTLPRSDAGYKVKANALTQSQWVAKDWSAAVGSAWVAGAVPSDITLSSLSPLTANGTSTETGTVTIVNNNNTVAANQTVTLSSSNPAVASVPALVTTNAQGHATYTVAAGKTAGTATITATAGSLSTKTTITTVAGPAAKVILSPATSSMAADGAASENLTATVVDANGNPVLTYNGTVGVVLTNTIDVAPTNALNGNTANDTVQSPYWFQAKNGVATITLQEPSSVNAKTDLGNSDTVTPILPGGMLETSETATVTLSAPKATYDVLGQVTGINANFSVAFTPIPSIIANTDQNVYLGAFVADQNQVPMDIGGGYGGVGTVNVHISGPATFTIVNNVTPSGNTVIKGQTVATLPLGVGSGEIDENVIIVPDPNATGTVTLTLSNPSNGLQIGSPVTIQVVAPQVAASWKVTSSTPTTFTADQVVDDAYAKTNTNEKANVWTGSTSGSTSAAYTIQAEDVNGLAVNAQPPSFAVTTASGHSVGNLSVTGVTADGGGSYSFELAYSGGPLAAGTYNVTVREGLMQTLTIPVTITPGKPYAIGVTPSGPKVVDVTDTNPTVTVTGQVEDALGNPVAAPGAQLTFTPSNTTQLSLAGGSVSAATGAATVYVNSSGAATVQAAALAQGNDGDVKVTGVLANNALTANGTSSLLSEDSASIDETQSVDNHLVGTVTGNGYVAGSHATSGKPFPEVLVTEENTANSPITSAQSGDTLDYSISSTNPFFRATQGSKVYTGINTPIPVAEIVNNAPLGGNNMAGTYTVRVWDASNSAVAPITETVTIDPGAAAGVGLFANESEVQQDVPNPQDGYPIDTNYKVPMTGTIPVTANRSVAVWVHVTDATGNIVNAPIGGVTVKLTMPGYTSNTAAFENAGGQIISQVTIPAGQNGVEVYLHDSVSESVPVMAMYQVVPTVSFAGTSNGAATVTPNGTDYDSSWTVNVTDQFGNPITGLTAAKDFTLADTSASPQVTYAPSATLAVGNFTVTPVAGSPGEYTITSRSSKPVPTADVATITVDGATITGTF